MDGSSHKAVLVLGADGRVGRHLIRLGLERGIEMRGQVRPNSPPSPNATAADPRDPVALAGLLKGCRAALYVLGYRGRGHVTFFSETTAALIAAMQQSGVQRLIAVTGVGAGETRGHGGLWYDKVIFPLFTRDLYADKERQEAMIRSSGLDWTVVRPAPFSRRSGKGRMRALTQVGPADVLRRIRTEDVASFMLDELETARFPGQTVFIGWP